MHMAQGKDDMTEIIDERPIAMTYRKDDKKDDIEKLTPKQENPIGIIQKKLDMFSQKYL